MKRAICVIFSLSLFLTIVSPSQVQAQPRRPFPQHVAYTEGTIKPNHVSQAELDAAVAAYYDLWKERYVFTVENSDPVQQYVHFNPPVEAVNVDWIEPENTVCRSEAQGYGMLTVGIMAGHDPDAKAIFDAMFRFVKAHPSNIEPNMMAWQQVRLEDGRIVSSESGEAEEPTDAATDGDLDIAYALLLADSQWGSDGDIDYRVEALNVLHGILQSAIHPTEHTILMGDWSKHKKDLDENHARYYRSTRSSDFMLNHLKAFAQIDTENTARWMAIYDKTVEIINTQYHEWSPNTGLIADFLIKNQETGHYEPPEGQLLEDTNDGDYNWNACRDPWRFPIDYLLTGDSAILEQLTTLNRWIQKVTTGDPTQIYPGYYIRSGEEGSKIPERDWGVDMSFLAPFAVSAMVHADNQEWLNALWNAIVVDELTDEDLYFGNNIRMQVLMVVSGNWWMPEVGEKIIAAQ